MLPVSGIENPPPVQPPSGDHGTKAAAPNANTGQLFSTALAQAISQAQGGGMHGGHGGGIDASGTSSHSGGHTLATNVTNWGSHPQHFPIAGSTHGGEHGVHEMALGLRAYRQQLIASNIANADTPGYKAVDIDFQEALRIARSAAGTPPLSLSNTAAGHLLDQVQSSALPYPLKYRISYQLSADGNTVEMDVERAKFAENAVMYEFSLDRVSGHFKMMMELLQSLKD